MAVERYNREELINAIWRVNGNVTRAAHELGCTDRTIHAYAQKYRTVRDAIEQARAQWRQRLIDIAELALEKELAKGSAWAVKYVLDTQGRSRGYGASVRAEHTGSDGGAIEVHVVYGDDIEAGDGE